MDQMHPFLVLRAKIRAAARQFRRNNDNSESLFHPAGGFVHAYDIEQVERALETYEMTLGSELVEDEKLTPEEYLIEHAKLMSRSHPAADSRAFAQDVLDYFEHTGTAPSARIFRFQPEPRSPQS